MENEFHIFDDFYNFNDIFDKAQQALFLNLIKIGKLSEIGKPIDENLIRFATKHMVVEDMGKNLENKQNIIKKTNDDFNEHTGDTIEDVKPFDIAVAVANAKAKQGQDNIVTLYTSKLTTHINNIIKKISLDGYRVCFVNIYDVFDKKFDELDTDRQVEIIGNVANEFRKGGYGIFVSLLSENGTMKKRTIKVSW